MEEITRKVCRKCGIEKPIEQFNRNVKSTDGYTHICQSCIIKKRGTIRYSAIHGSKLMQGSNPALAQFTPRELIEELRSRGYKGELSYTHLIKL